MGRTAFMAAPAALSPFSALCGESKSLTTPHSVADRVALHREATGDVPRQPRGPQHRFCSRPSAPVLLRPPGESAIGRCSAMAYYR